MAWQSMASPAIFAVIRDSLPRERRAMGFTLQSILKRLPIVIAPIAGGALIAALGVIRGIHTGLLFTLALAVVTVLLVLKLKFTISSHWVSYMCRVLLYCQSTFPSLLL